jgi:rare lipoprotein A
MTGLATWYGTAIPGGCASPSLSFGTVLRVTNAATGASTTCVVDDREGDTTGRIVDMSPGEFSQIASLSQGVITVTISW